MCLSHVRRVESTPYLFTCTLVCMSSESLVSFVSHLSLSLYNFIHFFFLMQTFHFSLSRWLLFLFLFFSHSFSIWLFLSPSLHLSCSLILCSREGWLVPHSSIGDFATFFSPLTKVSRGPSSNSLTDYRGWNRYGSVSHACDTVQQDLRWKTVLILIALDLIRRVTIKIPTYTCTGLTNLSYYLNWSPLVSPDVRDWSRLVTPSWFTTDPIFWIFLRCVPSYDWTKFSLLKNRIRGNFKMYLPVLKRDVFNSSPVLCKNKRISPFNCTRLIAVVPLRSSMQI